MLFNPKWSETKADPFSLASLIAWLQKMPADERYCYVSTGECLLAQYFNAHGFKDVIVGVGWFYEESNNHVDFEIPYEFTKIARPGHGGPTFGAALDRARKLAGA